jgi:hypothetical protein
VVQVLSQAVAVEMVQAEHLRVVVSVRAVLHFQLPELLRFMARVAVAEVMTVQVDSVAEELQIAEQAMVVASLLQPLVVLVSPTQVVAAVAEEQEMLRVELVDLV